MCVAEIDCHSSPVHTCFCKFYKCFYQGNGSLAAECSTVPRVAGVRAQLTAVAYDLRQATLPTSATWSGSEGYCIVE